MLAKVIMRFFPSRKTVSSQQTTLEVFHAIYLGYSVIACRYR